MANPTTGLGVATAVALTGAGVTRIVPLVAGTRGVSQYKVSVPVGGSVAVTASAVDDAGAAVGGGSQPTHLGTAASFAVLAASAVTGSAGAGSVVTGGDVGLYPGSSITNFPPSRVVAPHTIQDTTAAAQQAQLDLTDAMVYYNSLVATQTGLSDLSANDGGGGAGVYHAGVFDSAPASSLDIPTSITLDAQGDSTAIFVFRAGSTITLESGASVILANGAQAANVYWVVGSSFTSVWDGIQSNMVGTIMAVASVTLGGGDLQGRALASTAAVTMATTETIEVPGGSGAAGFNAITLASAPQAVLPSWYRPSNSGKSYSNVYMAPAVVDDNDSNPWIVRGRFPGETVIDFQIPTFGNTEGQSLVDVNAVMDETFIDTIYAQLIVTVTGGTS